MRGRCEQRRDELAALGVRAYPGLVYPHKAGMAEWLNGWALDYAEATPEVVPSATFYPEPGAVEYVTAARSRGVPGSSRPTCRSVATTRATRCSTRSGEPLPMLGFRS